MATDGTNAPIANAAPSALLHETRAGER